MVNDLLTVAFIESRLASCRYQSCEWLQLSLRIYRCTMQHSSVSASGPAVRRKGPAGLSIQG